MGYGRVVGLGLCVVDHSYLVEGLTRDAVRRRFHARNVAAGGMVGTALCQAAALGCEAHVLSAVGDDEDGRRVSRELRAAGVRTARLRLSPRLPTTVALVLVDRRSGERRFVVPDRRSLEARAPRFDLSPIAPGSVLLVDGHFPAQALRAVRLARERGARVVADFHLPRPGARRLLPWVDHPIVSQEYADAAHGGDARATLRALAARGGRPVVTQGERGGLYLEGARVRRYRAVRVRALDTTGAGDVFHGAFAAALVRGLSFEDALALASHAAARACTALGGAARLTTPDALPGALRRALRSGPRGR